MVEWHTQPEVRTFVDAGWTFCDLLTTPATRDVWLPALLSTTLALYTAGLALPLAPAEDAVVDPWETRPVTHEQWLALYQHLGAVLGEDRWYVAAPQMTAREPSMPARVAIGDLADDLADIYRDILPGLSCWESGPESDAAAIVWEWRFTFAMHWGQHAITAIGILHSRVMNLA